MVLGYINIARPQLVPQERSSQTSLCKYYMNMDSKMTTRMLVVTLALLLHKGAAQQTFNVEYLCDASNTLSITAWGTPTSIKTVHAENKGATCGTQADAGKTQFKLNGGSATSRSAGSIAAADETNCGYTATGTKRAVTLILSMSAIVTTDSARTTIECDSSKPNSIPKTASITSVTGNPTGTTIAQLVGDPKLVIMQTTTPNTAVPTTTSLASLALGKEFKIGVSISTKDSAKKALITTCTAKPVRGGTPEVKIITDKGCSDVTDSVFASTSAPKADSSVAEKYITVSPAFKAFRTANAATLYIECIVLVCSGTDTRCNIPTCTSVRRRRSSAEQGPVGNATLSSGLLLITSIQPDSSKDGIHGNQSPTFSSCLSHVSFISVVAILAVLLVVSLTVSVFFCSKLIGQNNNNQQREAYPNLGYKA